MPNEKPQEQRELVIARQQWKRLVRQGQSERDRLIIALLLYCGLKVGELRFLDRADFDLSTAGKETVTVNAWDEEKRRIIPLPAEVVTWLQEFLKVRPEPRCESERDALLISEHRVRETARQIQRVVARAGETAKLGKGITPRVLRHTYLARALQQAGDVQSVLDQVGLASVECLRRYPALSTRTKRDKLRRI